MIEFLKRDDVMFVGHNIAYDFGTWGRTYPDMWPLIFAAYKAGRVTDTAIRQQLIETASGAVEHVRYRPLSELVKGYLKIGMEGKEGDDIWRLRYSELHEIPVRDWPRAAQEYALLDAIYTYAVREKQNNYKHYLRDDPEQAYGALALTIVGTQGMRTCPVAVEAFRKEHQEKKDELTKVMEDNGLLVDGVKKQAPAKELIKAACKERGVEPLLTKSGKNTATDRAACYWAKSDLMLQRADYITAEKMIGTYYPLVLAGTEGPLTTRFGMAGSGRTTSSSPAPPLEGGNLQNAPSSKGLRECFIPRDGHVFLAADFSGAELHTLAQACYDRLGHSTLGDTLNAGKDVHLWMASRMLGISYDEASERYENGDKEVDEARQKAKAANFGFPGGMMERGFIRAQLKYGIVWDPWEVTALRNTWLKAFPEMEEYFAHAKFALRNRHGTIVEIKPSGRQRFVKSMPQYCNTLFQAPAADGAKAALAEVVRRSLCDEKSALYGSFPCNFIHDEIMIEVSKNPWVYRVAAKELEKIMRDEFNKVTPDCPVSTEAVVMAYWSKKAKPIKNDKGELLIWGEKEKQEDLTSLFLV
jgi:DNA polymerase-1